MQQSGRWLAAVVVVIIGALSLLAYARASSVGIPVSAVESESEPAHVEPIEGSELSRVTLSEKAAQRLNIQTAQIRDEQVGETTRQVIPYSALIYDPSGATWAYTNPEPLVYVRESITVDTIQGDLVVLSAGPPSGTTVVTVGAAELYGTEYGVGH
jgi:hypothetical protein